MQVLHHPLCDPKEVGWGAKKVFSSATAKDDSQVVVMGVNDTSATAASTLSRARPALTKASVTWSAVLENLIAPGLWFYGHNHRLNV